MANTISLDKVVDPGIKKHFVDGYKQLKPQIEKIYKTDSQESAADVLQNYTGIAGFAQVGEGQTFSEDSPIQSYGVTLTPVKFGKMIPVTYELTKWSKVKEIWNAASMLGREAARHIETRAADSFNDGFLTTATSYSDAKPLFSTTHPRADGGTAQSNASATGVVLSDANLEVALLALEFQLDDRGKMVSTFGNRLIVPNALRKTALQIVKSDNKSGSADNDANVYSSLQQYYGSLEVVVWNYLASAAGGSDTAWFLEDTSASKLMWQWADKPQVDRDNSIGFKQQTYMYRGFYYASKGWADWRGLWGSKGDGGAYSS
jgi:phage major head subunit gpT-like protein